jgi:hypothetical protein
MKDPRRAAANFFHILRGEWHERLVLGLWDAPSEAEAKRQAAGSVELFLRAYGKPKR